MSEYGKATLNESGNEASYGRPCLEVMSSLGRIVAYSMNQDGYSEIAIDLLREDGKVLQLAVVGIDEDDDDTGERDYQRTHVYCYDGVSGGVETTQYVQVNDDSAWDE